MKMKFFTLMFIVFCAKAFGQSSFDDLIKNVKTTSLPYASESEQTRLWYVYSDKQPKLHLSDSSFVVNKLKGIKQTIVNPDGGSSFGNLDWEEETLSPLGNAEIAILRVIKTDYRNGYILHIVTGGGVWEGILACVDSQGNLVSWMYADGRISGNSHGQLDREFKLLPNNTINIDEVSWGDNTEHYELKVTYKVVNNKFVLVKRKLLMSKSERAKRGF